MKHRRLVVAVLVATFALFGATQALARSHDITGYPDQINKVDLGGYVLQTSYPLGNNRGNTFKQTYLPDGKFAAECVSGPFFPCAGGANYVAMPVGPKQLMVTWYLDDGTLINHGILHPKALKDFLSYAYHSWRPPAPRFVLLVGDASWDAKNEQHNEEQDEDLPNTDPEGHALRLAPRGAGNG